MGAERQPQDSPEPDDADGSEGKEKEAEILLL